MKRFYCNFYDLNIIINRFYKKIKNYYIPLKNHDVFVSNINLLKKKKLMSLWQSYKNLNKFYFLRKIKFRIYKIKKNLKKINLNNKKKFKKYYFLPKKIKNYQLQQKKLNKNYLILKKKGLKMPRFEYKKRRSIYNKLKRAYKKSRNAFFKYKRKQYFLLKKKKLNQFNNYIKTNKNLKIEDFKNKNYGKNFAMKLFVKKKILKKNKIFKQRKFFTYSFLPILFNPSKFFNFSLLYYKLFFNFRNQRFWGKQRIIPTIVNLNRDIRITARNFKKSLKNDYFLNINFFEACFENIVMSGAKKGFLLKLKKQSYIFMLKNAIFLQFMKRRRKVKKKRRRKKINYK